MLYGWSFKSIQNLVLMINSMKFLDMMLPLNMQHNWPIMIALGEKEITFPVACLNREPFKKNKNRY